MTTHHIFPSHDAARAWRHHGPALARVAARLGRRAARQPEGQRGARPAGRALLRQRLSQQGMVGQGRRQETWSWARCSRRLTDFREKMLFIRGLYNERGPEGEHPQLADRQPALRRAAGLGRRDPLRHEHRSVARADATAARPRCRAWCWAARSRTRRSTRTIRCSTARTSRGARRRRRRRWSSIPALAFDRLFKDEVQRGDKSVLDAVLADANDLRRQISTTDQRKLDEYLDSVRDVEQRIENAGKQGELQGWRPTLDKPNIPRPADGIPQNIAEHMRLMCDILVLGFQTDTTRITHAQAEQRPLVAALPAPGRRLHDPPPAVALRHGRLAEGEPVLRRATRLHRPQARRDPGRRAHRARQLDDPVLFEHDDRQPRRHAVAGRAARAAAAAGSRPAACSTTATSPTARCAGCTCR